MRAVYLAFLACAGQPQAPTVRMQPNWRFYDVLFSLFSSLAHLIRGSWENIIFIMNTAEGHSMTAVEAALPVSDKMLRRNSSPEADIARIRARMRAPALTIVNKLGTIAQRC